VVSVTLAVVLLARAGGFGLEGVLVATTLGPLVGLVVATRLLSRSVRRPWSSPKDRAAPSPAREMLAASWPLIGSGLLAFLVLWKDVFLLARFRTPVEVGVYAACARLAMVVLIVHESLGPLFLARLSDLFVAG